MSGIVARAHELRHAAETARSKEDIQREAQAFQGRVQTLTNWRDSARSLIPAARAMRKAGKRLGAIEEVKGIKASAARALKDFQEDPASAIRPEVDAANIFWGQAAKKLGAAEVRSKAEWREHVMGSMPPYQPDVVEALAGSQWPRIQGTVLEARAKSEILARTLPTNDAEVAELDLLVESVAKALKGFDLSGEDQEVQAFVQSALSDGATAEQYTDGVQRWLRRKDLDSRIRLVFRHR